VARDDISADAGLRRPFLKGFHQALTKHKQHSEKRCSCVRQRTDDFLSRGNTQVNEASHQHQCVEQSIQTGASLQWLTAAEGFEMKLKGNTVNKSMNYKKCLAGFASVLLIVSASGCGGGDVQDPIPGGGPVQPGSGAPANATVPSNGTATGNGTVPVNGTTPDTSDTTAPMVSLVNPADLGTGICLEASVNATFNEAMNASTITAGVFALRSDSQSPGEAVAGTIVYDTAGKSASFTPTRSMNANTRYTATISNGAKDLAGNALANSKIWTFTTGSQACTVQPAPVVALNSVARFGNLGGSAGTTSTGTLTVINGDIATTATAASALTGFHDTAGDIYTETGSNQGAVNGKIFTCTVSTTGPTSAAVNVPACDIAAKGRGDAQTAFDNLSPASIPGGIDPGAGELGGLTLFPGTYKAAGGSFQITGSDLTLDARGDANAAWVFQTASTLTVGTPAAPRNITLINGAQAKNVFWRVGTSATINAAGGGTMVGTILASSAISFSTVGNVAVATLNGRAVALNASVTMTNTVINVPAQ
jgi:hypothetical protein